MPPSLSSLRSLFARTLGLGSGAAEHSGDEESQPQAGGAGGPSSGRRPAPAGPPGECYACTQPGVPAFHSTTCDQVHSPGWDADAGSSLVPVQAQQLRAQPLPGAAAVAAARWLFGPVLDPRSKRVQRWNRWILLGRAAALAVDPLFFYALSIGRAGRPCMYMDAGLAAAVTALRTCADVAHLAHVLVQFRLAYVSRESLVVGCGKLVWDPRAIAAHYARSLKGLCFDLFVILPIPQIIFWLVIPKLIREEQVKVIMTILLLIFVLQFLPKVYHSIYIMRKMQKVTGYIFGTVWWGFGLNLFAYFIASHIAGGCWYVLAIQRVASCLQSECEINNNCNLMSLACSKEMCFHFPWSSDMTALACDTNLTSFSQQNVPACLSGNGAFAYGIYKGALPVISSNSLAVKILYPIFWGLMTLSTFGNDLEPTSNWLEVIFSIINVLSGLMLFTLLIGNIQVFLHAVLARKRKMQLRFRDMEWWMRRRQLPSRLRQRVRKYERERWAAITGDEEMEMIKDLPEGLRRDIKRYLCLELVKQVPLFHGMDELILDNICDRLRPLVFCGGEKVIREGDPVQRMVFILQGRLRSTQPLTKGVVAECVLGAGSFLGDELLSWCLRRPFVDRLPASSATFECVEAAQAFCLDAPDLRYITEHFRYKARVMATAVLPPPPAGAAGPEDGDRRLRHYAAMFMSLRPHDHLE
ncbi:unnamed protein product [Triticum turgidum subsp. durum]|uniref:Cyclic nucleotide-binding domain-containing protein n=1 Tax=Triticum turgidum subsp. durum TaxID=4567 RepID=A0A9R0WT63_TRITD|nr:unnamed protein product [Triticum turgidum subsp. durum]